FLRAGNSLDELKEQHGIDYTIYNDKISLSYNQLTASSSDELASQCRGLILRDKTYDIVAAPFFRFFNYGDGAAADSDWNTAVAYEKLDGTLIIAYYDDVLSKWCVATRKRPEADGNVNGALMTFDQLFDNAIKSKTKGEIDNKQDFMALFGASAKEFTFCFELTGPYNRVVVNYEEPNIILLGARRLSNLKEYGIINWSHIKHFDIPKTYNFN